MFEVSLAGQANLLCDTNGVVKNTSILESTLSNNHNAIDYHCVREAAASGIMRVGKEDTATDLADPSVRRASGVHYLRLLTGTEVAVGGMCGFG